MIISIIIIIFIFSFHHWLNPHHGRQGSSAQSKLFANNRLLEWLFRSGCFISDDKRRYFNQLLALKIHTYTSVFSSLINSWSLEAGFSFLFLDNWLTFSRSLISVQNLQQSSVGCKNCCLKHWFWISLMIIIIICNNIYFSSSKSSPKMTPNFS